MDRPVRTRFAPSPTGELHVGNLRIAVFNQLYARGKGGAYVLRVEDTDTQRNLKGSLESMLADMRWFGLDWDEGPDIGGPFGPYFQSEREGRHREVAADLERRGLAYRCFCAPDRSEAEQDDTDSEVPYRRGCEAGCRELNREEADRRQKAASTPPAIRFAVPNDTVVIQDEIRGSIQFSGSDIEDFVIQRSDGRATYNLAVVVDDVDMEISHVIRGSGHISNTPKQALLFDALGATRPVFAHLPTVVGPDGAKLSKRTGAPGISQLRAEGLHPDAVVNYLSLLGWSPGDDREVLGRDELIAAMDLARVRPSNTMYDPEKLRWMSAQHIARMPLEDLADRVWTYLDREAFPLSRAELPPALDAVRSRLHAFGEVNVYLWLVFAPTPVLDGGRRELAAEPDSPLELLRTVRGRLAGLPAWTSGATDGAVREVGKELGRKGPALFHPVRLALCGGRSGPDLGKVLVALGRDRALGLLDHAILAVSAAS
jgi:glutamyl-tRNA synthetase